MDDTWKQRATFVGLGREFAAGFGIGEKGYLGLGRVWSKDLWEYTPEIVRTTYSSNPVSLTDKLITDGRWSGTNKVVYSDSSVNIGLGTKVPLAKLDVDGGIRTKYSGSVVTLVLGAGVQTVNLTISPLPFDWDFTNTMLQVSNTDGGTGIIYQAKLTSPTNITLTYNAITPGQVRFNYIVFKL